MEHLKAIQGGSAVLDAACKPSPLFKPGGDDPKVEAIRHGLKLPGMIVTKLGRMNYLESYGDLKLDRMFFLPAVPGSVPNTHQMILGSVSISGRLTLSLNYVEDVSNSVVSPVRDMIQILNRALEYLGFPEKTSDRAI